MRPGRHGDPVCRLRRRVRCSGRERGAVAVLVALLTDGTSAPDANYCGTFTGSSSDVCICGYFTQKLIPASALPSGGGTTNLSATSIRLTG